MNQTERKLDLLITTLNRNTLLLNELGEKVERLLTLQPSSSRKAHTVNAPDHEDLWQKRIGSLEHTFWRLANCDWQKRQDAYNFPAYLLERLGNSPTQAVVVSVLVNHASLLKAFRPTLGEKGDPKSIALEALKRSTLFSCPASAAFETTSATVVALSPGSAERFVRNKRLLPDVWLGWTCSARGIAPDQPFEDREVIPIADVAGARVWGEEEDEPGAKEVPEEDEEGGGEIEAAETEDHERDEPEKDWIAEANREADEDDANDAEEPEPTPAKPAKPYKTYEKRVDTDGVPVIGGRRFLLGRKDDPEKEEVKPAGNPADPLASRPGLRPLNVVSRSKELD